MHKLRVAEPWHFPTKDLLPGTIDDFIAQRIEHYRELIAAEQNPIINEKYKLAIHALAKAPRLIDKLQDALTKRWNLQIECSQATLGWSLLLAGTFN